MPASRSCTPASGSRPAQIVNSAVEEDVDVVGLSVLSGSHLSVVPDVVAGLREAGLDDVPVVVGGIIPEADAAWLRENGVARVFTPKDFEITDVLSADRRRRGGRPRLSVAASRKKWPRGGSARGRQFPGDRPV